MIGAGRWAENCAHTLRQLHGAPLVAISTRSVNGARRAASFAPRAECTMDWRRVIRKKDVDAVIIVTPASSHYTIARAALEHGKHVFVEKPLTLSSRHARLLIRLAEKEDRVLMVGHLHRYNPAVERLRDDRERFGAIRYLVSTAMGDGPVREDVSALWDYMPHDLTIFRFVLGAEPLSVRARGACFLGNGREDLVQAEFEFSKRVRAFSTVSWLSPVKRRELILSGSAGHAVFDDYATEKLRYYLPSTVGKGGPPNRVPRISGTLPLTAELRHFITCILRGRQPLTNGLEGLQVVRILEACQRSLEKDGRRVRLGNSQKNTMNVRQG